MDGAALPEPGRGPVWWEWLVTQHLQKSDDEGVYSNVGHKDALRNKRHDDCHRGVEKDSDCGFLL